MDINISGINYRTGKLDAKKQFHIARKLAPILLEYSDLQKIIAFAVEGGDGIKDRILSEIGGIVNASKKIAVALSSMTNADSEYVIDTCLSVCEREDGRAYQRVAINGNLLYQDIDLVIMSRLVKSVISENLGNFLDALS